MRKLFPFFCGRDCGGDACPLLAEVEDGRVVRMRRNPRAPAAMNPCPKGFAVPRFHYSPERIRQPLIRRGARGSGDFVPIPWEAALSLVSRHLAETRAKHGAGAVMCLSSAGGTGALHKTEVLTQRFLNLTGGCVELAGNYSSNAAAFALTKMFGGSSGSSGFDAATIAESKLVILWGANIFEARLGSELTWHVMTARKRGVPVVCVDPRRTATARALDAEWIAPLPGRDFAIMYALLYVFSREGIIDMEYVDRRAVGFGSLLDHVEGKGDGVPKDPAWAEKISGVPAGTIERLAGKWADAKPCLLLPGYSIQRTAAGEETARLCVALQLATGNFGKLGGSTGSLNNRLPGPTCGRIDGGWNPGGARVPILRWPDAILEGAAGSRPPVRVIYSAGGNFLNQGADIQKNIAAFESVDFSVCHEMFMTPTARHCDLVLPVASPLQKEDIGIPWAGDYLLYKPRILPMEGQERQDYEIFRELAAMAGREHEFSFGREEGDWIDSFLEESEIDDAAGFKTSGIYLGKERERAGLADFAADPELFPLLTASGKIEFGSPLWSGNVVPAGASGAAIAGGAQIMSGAQMMSGAAIAGAECADRARIGPCADLPYLLVTPKAADRVHSQGGDHPEKIFEAIVEMNPEDAAALGIAEGGYARIWNGSGSMRAKARVSDCIRAGVVSIPEGVWYRLGESGAEGSPNSLTSTEGTSESLSCIMHGIPVGVGKE